MREMALLNPAYGLILPFLFIFTVPIAFFAALTTLVSFSILLFRVTLIYFELALAVIPHYVLGTSTTTSRSLVQTRKSTASPSGSRRRRRRGSSSSNISAGTITPITGDNNSSLGLSQSIGPARDFEGVGGWRLDNPSEDDLAVWTNINSRLELPADHGRRHHYRALTSGSSPGDVRQNRSHSPETLMNTSRARTPPTSVIGTNGEYFPPVLGTPRPSKRSSSGNTAMSSSSGSSKGVELSMKGR